MFRLTFVCPCGFERVIEGSLGGVKSQAVVLLDQHLEHMLGQGSPFQVAKLEVIK